MRKKWGYGLMLSPKLVEGARRVVGVACQPVIKNLRKAMKKAKVRGWENRDPNQYFFAQLSRRTLECCFEDTLPISRIARDANSLENPYQIRDVMQTPKAPTEPTKREPVSRAAGRVCAPSGVLRF